MSYSFYKILHMIGIMTLFVGLASILILAFVGQLKSSRAKMIGFATHGLGLFLMILSGFGMAAKLQMFAELPGWLYAKIGIWLLLGLAISLLKRKPQWAFGNLIVVIALGGTAAWLAITKPF